MLSTRVIMGSGLIWQKPSVLYFDGTSQAITIPNTNNRLQPAQQMCWEMWFKLDGYTQYNTLMGFANNNWDFARMDSLIQFVCHTYNSTGSWIPIVPTGFSDINDGEWHHMAIVWDGINGERWGFIDGVQRYYATMTQGLVTRDMSSQANFTIGAVNNGGSRKIKGWIKEVRLWEIAKTQSEIIDTMNISLTGNEVGLQAYYPLNEGDGVVVHDLANGYDGLVNGATWQVG